MNWSSVGTRLLAGVWGIGMTAAALGAAAPDPAALVAGHLAAAGGPAWDRIETVVVRSAVRERDQRFTMELRMTRQGEVLAVATLSADVTVRFARDAAGQMWTAKMGRVMAVTDPKDTPISMAAPFFPSAKGGALAGISSGGGAVTETMEGGAGLTVCGGEAVFERATGLLRRLNRCEFSDYREVEGRRVPFAIKDGPNVSYEITGVHFNEPVDSAVFAMPAGRAATVAAAMEGRAGGARTQLSAPGKLEVVREPALARWNRPALDALPRYDGTSERQWQVDLRSRDVSGLDLSGRLEDLRHAEFDSRTRWPAKLPGGFEPAGLMEANRNPGLGVRALHARGITGKGVSIGIIDQTLLVRHREYRDRLRLYEEIHLLENRQAAMHGAAVASIAVGKTVGVAPGSDLYFIAETHGEVGPDRKFEFDFTWLAKSLDRLLEVNRTLPVPNRIRVVAAAIGWRPGAKGYAEITAAVERAKAEGVFVVSSSLEQTHQLRFQGLGRDPASDPDAAAAYRPGEFWAKYFWQRPFGPNERLLVPMDSRAVASPTGPEDYVFYPRGGWSWSIPWIAGLYALACEVKPEVTPEQFWAAAMASGRTITIKNGDRTAEFGTIVDPAALIERLQGGGTM